MVEAPRIYTQSAHESGKVVSLTHRPPLPPRRYSWYPFLLEAESTPQGHSATGRIKRMKNPNDHNVVGTHDLPAYTAVPQPTAPPCTAIIIIIIIIITITGRWDSVIDTVTRLGAGQPSNRGSISGKR